MLEGNQHSHSTTEDGRKGNGAHSEGLELNSVFQKLEVDCPCQIDDLPSRKDDLVYPCGVSSGNSYHGKISSRSPTKDKTTEHAMKSSSRSKPYAMGDLPFGDALDQLTLKSEQCLNLRCHCNSQLNQTAHCTSDSLNFVHACQNQKMYTKKILRDAKLKLHHRQKDHNGVLRAAKLKLHKLNSDWYKSMAPRKGTVQRKSVFGERSSSDIEGFNTLSRKTDPDVQQPCGQLFTSYRSTEPQLVRQKMIDAGQQEESMSSCTCSVQARLQTDYNVEELAGYLEDFLYLPKEMSPMAEMMYT